MLKVVAEQLNAVYDAGDAGCDLDLRGMLSDWEVAKAEELAANQRRMAIEQQMATLLAAPDEGQKSHRIGAWRVTRTNKVYYRGDTAKLLTLAGELNLPKLTKEVADETAIKRLRKASAYDFDLLVAEGAVVATPAKPHFEVVRVPVAEPFTA